MKLTRLPLALALVSAPALADVTHLPSRAHTSALRSRAASAAFNEAYLSSNYQNGDRAPLAKSGDAAGQTVVKDNAGGSNDDSQRPQCPTIFIGTAAVDGSAANGWQFLPQLVGFDLERSLNVGGGVQPVYMETNKDASKVKRVLITQPGLPRDTWKYLALFRNSLICAVANSGSDLSFDDILVVAPAWLSDDDANAGAAQSNDIRFKGSGWATGANSVGPGSTSVSSMDVMDALVASFFDKSKYPAVQSVYIGGHSLGASFTQRYALLRKPDDNDSKLGFWVGNPGAYLYPTSDRPVSNVDNCSGQDEYPYGLAGGLPPYAAQRVASDRQGVIDAFKARKVQYALGTADREAGDTHCEAQYQGTDHLSRGENFQRELSNIGSPPSQTFNMVEGVEHQDYLMMSDSASQKYLFVDGIDFKAAASASASSSAGASSTRRSGSGSGTASNTASGATASGTAGPSGQTSGAASKLCSKVKGTSMGVMGTLGLVGVTAAFVL